MEREKHHHLTSVATLALLVLWWTTTTPATACSSDGKSCGECISDQMKYGCPSCVPLLHCMARCLWGGTPRAKCTSKCDCNGGQPPLAECKKCMVRCKCSCVM